MLCLLSYAGAGSSRMVVDSGRVWGRGGFPARVSMWGVGVRVEGERSALGRPGTWGDPHGEAGLGGASDARRGDAGAREVDEDERDGFAHGGWAVPGNDEVMASVLGKGM